MNRDFYLALARSGAKMPLGTDLVLHEHPDADAIRRDGERLGKIIVEAARRYHTPLAIPQMDLTLEKAAIVELLGIADGGGEFHFATAPEAAMLDRFRERLAGPLPARVRAHVELIGYVARNSDLVPVGMCIGPVSLMTKLLADPITPIMMAGAGTTAEDEPEVMLMKTALDLATRTVLRVVEAQIAAGAKVVMIAEPATNIVFFSPKQIRQGSDVFERYAMAPNREIRALLARHNVALFFHCCGELINEMVIAFASLDPAVLSLGMLAQVVGGRGVGPEGDRSVRQPSKQALLFRHADLRGRRDEALGGTRGSDAGERAPFHSGDGVRRSPRARMRADDQGEGCCHDDGVLTRGERIAGIGTNASAAAGHGSEKTWPISRSFTTPS